MHYIWQTEEWPNFTWDHKRLLPLTECAAHKQGRLLGRMEGLGFEGRNEAQLEALTDDVVHSSEIEGENLPASQVRSSIVRQLGMKNISNLVPSSREVDSVVAMMTDATTHYDKALSKERLFKWHSSLFAGENSNHRITIGRYRDGPMKVVSGLYGKERVHFEAPSAIKLNDEMNKFLNWFNKPEDQATCSFHHSAILFHRAVKLIASSP